MKHLKCVILFLCIIVASSCSGKSMNDEIEKAILESKSKGEIQVEPAGVLLLYGNEEMHLSYLVSMDHTWKKAVDCIPIEGSYRFLDPHPEDSSQIVMNQKDKGKSSILLQSKDTSYESLQVLKQDAFIETTSTTQFSYGEYLQVTKQRHGDPNQSWILQFDGDTKIVIEQTAFEFKDAFWIEDCHYSILESEK